MSQKNIFRNDLYKSLSSLKDKKQMLKFVGNEISIKYSGVERFRGNVKRIHI